MYPENYYYGVTCMPGAKNNPSPDNSVYVFTASFQGEGQQISNLAHELYGHAYFFELSKSTGLNPNHTFGVIGTGVEYDEVLGNLSYNIYGETNQPLVNQINAAVTEALFNYEKNWKQLFVHYCNLYTYASCIYSE